MLIKSASAFDRQLSEVATPVTFALMCGSTSITDLVRTFLEQDGFCHDPDAAITLLMDEPSGFALAALAGLAGNAQHTIVLTSNRCPEYWDELSDRGAQILIAGDHPGYPHVSALLHAASGARYRVTPNTPRR